MAHDTTSLLAMVVVVVVMVVFVVAVVVEVVVVGMDWNPLALIAFIAFILLLVRMAFINRHLGIMPVLCDRPEEDMCGRLAELARRLEHKHVLRAQSNSYLHSTSVANCTGNKNSCRNKSRVDGMDGRHGNRTNRI